MISDITKLNKIRENIFTIMMCLDSCDYAITEISDIQDLGDLKQEVDIIRKATSEFISKMDNSLEDDFRDRIGNIFDVFYKYVLKKYVKKNFK